MVLPRLKEVREEKGLTTTELAALAGMGDRNITRIESGRGTTLATGKKLAKVLKSTLEILRGVI